MENKYEIVKKSLLEQILAGKYAVNDKLPTESELMKRFEVSRYTVRRAVGDLENDHYVYRIQGGGIFVDDWVQQQESRPLKNKMIGVLTTHIANYIFPNIITGIDRTISKAGYSLLLSNTQNNPEKERKSLMKMMENNLSGLIIEPTQSALNQTNFDLYEKLATLKLPLLFINAHYNQLDFPYLEIDDQASGRELTNYLFEQGHQRILGVFKTDDLQGVHRMNGFITAYQQQAGEPYLSESIMFRTADNMATVFKRVKTVLDRPERPTAIVCYNDQLAIQLIAFVKSLGFKVPQDISIVGFDDYQLSAYVDPPLTTVAHPKEQLGHDAGTAILALINKKTVTPLVYPPHLVIRHSVRDLTAR
ncbi:GntR family transcriptional regulator [Lapidilactobacillus achengensis]|uniref:GntR family transcriptional regulator n=1 Tax=Lapidilactobacillus achengensis TaxID=2486000 RepID=A0ABW1USA8_9LACO|nr:GntR family transcriptional regulator [Lapidilactobacillus achengensis]